MKLHLPCLLRRVLLAAFAVVSVASAAIVSTTDVCSDYLPIGSHYTTKLDASTGEILFEETSDWNSRSYKTVVDVEGNKIKREVVYLYQFADRLWSRTIAHVSLSTYGSYSSSSSYENDFFNQQDGGGEDYILSCSSFDENGTLTKPGVWVLAPSQTPSDAVYKMHNYGDIRIADCRQEIICYTPTSADPDEDEQAVLGLNDYHYIRSVHLSPASTVSVDRIGFNLDVSDSDSFTYTRGFTQNTASFSMGTHVYTFTNVKDIEFSDNHADNDGGVLYGSSWGFYIDTAENVRIVRNTSGGKGSFGYGEMNSSMSGEGNTGGLQIRHVTGEVLFDDNDGECLMHNVNCRFSDINKLTFTGHSGVLFDTHRASVLVQMQNCKEVTFSSNGNSTQDSPLFSYNSSSSWAALWSITDCGDVRILDNECRSCLVTAASPKIARVNNVIFSGNHAYDGVAITSTLRLEDIRGSVRIIGNTAEHVSGVAVQGALFSGTTHGFITAAAPEGEEAELFSISGNTAEGFYSQGFLGNGANVERFAQVVFDDNELRGEQNCESLFMALNINTFDSLSISGNIVDVTGEFGGLMTSLALSDFGSVVVHGNSIRTTKGLNMGLLGNAELQGRMSEGVRLSSFEISDNRLYCTGYEKDVLNHVNLTNFDAFVCSGNRTETSGSNNASSLLNDNITLAQTNTITVEHNSCYAADDYAFGGGLGGNASFSSAKNVGDIVLRDSGDIVFRDNHAEGKLGAYGGGLFAYDEVTITGNRSVSFIGNSTKADHVIDVTKPEDKTGFVVPGGSRMHTLGTGALGGALFAMQGQTRMLICNNDSFVTRGNYVTDGTTYSLQGIAVSPASSRDTFFAAPENRTMELYDGLYIGGNLNLGFADSLMKSNPTLYPSSGTNFGKIVFSCCYAEDDLSAIKSAAGAGAVTEEELAASRLFYIGTKLLVNQGELEIADGAKLHVNGVLDMVGSDTKLTLLDGARAESSGGFSLDGNQVMEMKRSGYESLAVTQNHMCVSGNAVLNITETSTLSVGRLQIGSGGTLALNVLPENSETAVLTLNFAANYNESYAPGLLVGVKLGSPTVALGMGNLALSTSASLPAGDYVLLTLQQAEGTKEMLTSFNSDCAWTAGKQVTGLAEGDSLSWVEKEDGSKDLVWHLLSGIEAPHRDAAALTWSGASGTWQTNAVGAWTSTVDDLTFYKGDKVVFDSAAEVNISGAVAPSVIEVMNESGTVKLMSENGGGIEGDATLTKTGSGKLTISTANTYTGGTTLNGGTLEVANARALGSGVVTMTGGTLAGTLSGTTIQASGGNITAELTGSNSITGANWALSSALRNSGTLSLSGSFAADKLELRHSDATHVDVNGSFGAAGFAKAAFDAVTVVNGGSVINMGATVTHGSLSLELGSDGVASRGGAVDLSEYLLVNGTAATSSAIHAKSATASVTMKGGTLTADDAVQVTATGGALVLNGGSLSGTLNNVTLTMTRGSLNTSLGGSSSLVGNQYALTKTLSNTGTLRVRGSFDASALNLKTTGITHVDVNGVSGASGFTKYGDSSVTLINGGTVVNDGVLITHGNLTLALGTDGVARATGTTVMSDYLLAGSDTVTTAAVHGKSSAATITQTGGTLTVNDTATVNATAGAISLTGGTLNGTLSGTSVTATGGTLAASLSGSNTLTGQNYAVQRAISNEGTLTVSGSFKADKLSLKTVEATHVDVNGKSGASGFAKEAEYSVTLVNGGTVINQGAVVTHGGVQLTLSADGTAKSAAATDSSLYLLTGKDSVSTSAVHAKSASASVAMTGGTLTVNDRAAVSATAGVVKLNGGTLVGSLTTSNDLRLNVQQTSSMEGSLTLGGGVLSLCDTLTLDGILSVSGDTELDIRNYTQVGDYTLIRAAGITGDLSMLSYAPPTRQFGYTLSRSGNDLKLLVSRLSENHVWTQPKGTLDGHTFAEGDTLEVTAAAAITLSGEVKQGGVTVATAGKVTFTADKKTPGSGLGGDGSVTKSGIGLLTMNAGNTYTGGTVLNAGTLKATAVDSFGTGDITVKGGTLDLGSKAVANDIVLSGEATLKGDAKYTGNVSVAGDAMLLAKTSYKGMTTIGAGSTLTLAPKATMAGSITIEGGALDITAPKGMTLAKNMTMLLNGGSVSGLLTIGTGSTLVWQDGSFETSSPVLKGGTLDLGGENALTLTGSKAQVAFGDKALQLPGKGTVRTDETLVVNSGSVTVNSLGGYEGEIAVNGGTLKLSTGKVTTENDIVVNGNAAVVNGGTHYGNITVDGLLAKGTTIKLLDENQKVALNGEGAMLGTISGKGIIDVNADITATAAKLTAATINLNSGTFTNTKGIKLAKGQTLTLAGANLNLGPKGALATVAGSTLVVDTDTTLTGSLTLGGGELVLNGATLQLDGTLTLSKAMTVTGSGTMTYTTLKPFKGDIAALLGGAEVEWKENSLLINGGASKPLGMAAAPEDAEEGATAPLDAAPVPMPAANPVADAMVQADWGILDAERAFMGAVAGRSQHATLLNKGRGAAWVSAFGASVRHGNQGTHHGSDGNIEGAAFGLEHAVSDTGTLGLAVGRSKNRLAATGVTHLRQETAHVALYGQKQLKHGFTAEATATYGDTETKLGAASWQQKSAGLSARLTHAKMLSDATAFRTFGGLTYEATDSASILGEAHAGSVQNLRGELGAGITHTAGKAHFYAEAALTGDMVRHNPTVDFGGVRTHGANPGRLGVRATVGGIYEFTDTWSGTASYGIEAESRSTAHTLNIGVSKSF